MPKAELAALVALPALCGGAEIWARAEKLLAGTLAWTHATELRALYDIAIEKGLAPNVLVDLGEARHFAYYTGVMFQVLADGPGEAVGSGGRYDRLFDRFGVSRSAAGFAVDLGNLGWALERSGKSADEGARLLVSAPSTSGDARDALLSELRRRGATTAEAPEGDTNAYAIAWRYTHRVELRPGGVTVVDVRTLESRSFDAPTPRDAALAILGYVGVKPRESENV
jgi:ATP phosphoribosyltransferase regulatory subunit